MSEVDEAREEVQAVLEREPSLSDQSMAELTQEDQALAWTMATLLLDVVPAFSKAAARCIYEQLPALPGDEVYSAMEDVAFAGPRELLTALRAGMPASAHETPVEMLAHARYLQRLGLGMHSLVDVYKIGFPMFRHVVLREIEEHARDRAQCERIATAADAYSFAFISTVLTRQAVEFGLPSGPWTPTADDPAFSHPAAMEAARKLREEEIARGSWLAASPEQSRTRAEAEHRLDAFAATVERGVRDHDMSHLLRLADTTLTITLADEADLSLTLLLDREPVEVLDGESDTESCIRIASLDLERIWSPDFYLPMAIAKGRVSVDGPVRKFLRVVPLMRGLAAVYEDVAASLKKEHSNA